MYSTLYGTGGDEHVGKDEESEDEDNYSDGIEVD